MPSRSLPLAKVFQVKGLCEDCGWRTVIGRRDLAQIRLQHQLSTPEEVGSLITCPHCEGRGGKGKNISIRIIDASGVVTPVRIDRRPLSEIEQATTNCPDCGRQRVFGREMLDDFAAEMPTVDELWKRSYCGNCVEAGGQKKTITLIVEPPMPEPKDSPKPNWSKKAVFGEDRSDPIPTLPRKKLFA